MRTLTVTGPGKRSDQMDHEGVHQAAWGLPSSIRRGKQSTSEALL